MSHYTICILTGSAAFDLAKSVGFMQNPYLNSDTPVHMSPGELIVRGDFVHEVALPHELCTKAILEMHATNSFTSPFLEGARFLAPG